ncbi:hypothetical protein KL930_004478 [Ogataea haglerorum]|uniref:3beta-hydroxysteroid 3-dehydrogenase n=1 Tax=Ogataea haglerorum TaxID=1937702 RepID=A0AAN6D2U2_9ASCO|nr:hypothetical protein KL915_004585 [Ogataea haglerorum]KAG7703485.1 hypothetical protein KL950_004713 [Ogataea haglerorum]KAG7703950.1 hypothetical protein KL914_004441 [Ogataea haglerorum]KAG7715570.1 hypothetical protein KL913_003905 [Ogataea haglerorum]KAG7716092.1 hypothetical protein KL949_003987 [Ogataea haglerorum]
MWSQGELSDGISDRLHPLAAKHHERMGSNLLPQSLPIIVLSGCVTRSLFFFSMSLVALITGTNSNLGLNIAYRLLAEVPSETRLTIIVTSRTLPKAIEAINKIKEHNEKHVRRRAILDFDYVLVDFSNMVSILAAIHELKKMHRKLDYLFVNAAQGVYSGIDWIQATKEVLASPVQASTFPTYKIQKVGVRSADGLGLVFQANVFGPYYFVQHLAEPLLSHSENPRVVWISSIMSKPSFLSFDDLQLLRSDISYEGSKRLVDLLHLGTYKELKSKYGINQYLTHPGIFTSFSFFQYLNPLTFYGMLLMFYVARLCGSPWHNISGWKGANAPIFVCLEAKPELDLQEKKYGSACTITGKEYLKIAEIDATGQADVAKYFKDLKLQWDEKLKNQIADTRKVYADD